MTSNLVFGRSAAQFSRLVRAGCRGARGCGQPRSVAVRRGRRQPSGQAQPARTGAVAPQPDSLGSHPPGGRGSRRRPALAVMTLLAAATSLITACGVSTAGPATGDPAGTATGDAPATWSSPLGTEILGAYFPATARQYAAGAEFSGTMLSLQTQITAACMARHGFKFPTVSATAAAARIWDLSQFPDIARMKQSGLMVPILKPASPRPPALPSGKKQAYHTDLSGCTALAGRPFGKLRPDAESLSSEWITIFTSIQTSPQVQGTLAQFSSCVRHAGAPAGYSQNLNRFAVWAGAQMTVPSTGVIQLGPDKHWGAVFARCAQNLAALYEKLQVAARAQFFQRHYPQVRRLAAEVSQMVVSAEQLIKANGSAPG
jgi:hypothetical protein